MLHPPHPAIPGEWGVCFTTRMLPPTSVGSGQKHSILRHSTAQHSTAQHDPAQLSTCPRPAKLATLSASHRIPATLSRVFHFLWPVQKMKWLKFENNCPLKTLWPSVPKLEKEMTAPLPLRTHLPTLRRLGSGTEPPPPHSSFRLKTASTICGRTKTVSWGLRP